MDIEIITQLISQVGFPIAVCMVCFWYINKIQTQHREELQSITEAVNNNTIVIQKLIDKLG